MSRLNFWQWGTSSFLFLTLTSSAVTPLIFNTPAEAGIFTESPSQTITNTVVIPEGTTIPVKYPEANKILVTFDETAPLTVEVSANIVNRRGTVLIPKGSQIVGQLQPAEGGSQFVAETLIIDEDKEYNIEGSSKIITRIETVKKGASAKTILMGTAAGAGAATVIAAVTGDRAIATEEVLGGAAIGTLGGWLLGRKSVDLIAIYPNEGDLNVTLDADLVLE